jgi:hypothetical protein
VADGRLFVAGIVTPDCRVGVEAEILSHALKTDATSTDNAIDLLFMTIPSLESLAGIYASTDTIEI